MNYVVDEAVEYLERRSLQRLWAKYRADTMCDLPTFAANLELAERVRDLPGAIVECGTWRGGMIAAIAEHVGPGRPYHLLDSFQGLPPAHLIDGPAALEWQRTDPNNCRATMDEASATMRMSGAKDFYIHGGWFIDTISPSMIEFVGTIALLRLDADWYDSTLCCLHSLFSRVISGGIVIVDDYYVWDGCARAVHEFLSTSCGCECRIREHDGVAYVVRT